MKRRAIIAGNWKMNYDLAQSEALAVALRERRAQVRAALRGLSAADAHKLVLAYEPVWAIGSGKPASAAGANAVIGLTIRGVLSEQFGEAVAQSVRVQYGGSVGASNIEEFMQQP